MSTRTFLLIRSIALVSSVFLAIASSLLAQEKVAWSDQEKPIVEQIRGLRKLDDTVRVRVTKELALQIRQLPVVPNKLRLALALSNLSLKETSAAIRCRKSL
jgi:hypothetical protein